MSRTLNQLVRERDERLNTPRMLEVTKTWSTTKSICVVCRHSPNVRELLNEWERQHPPPWLGKRPRWPGLNGKCPECGGMLAEVTW